MNPVEFFYRQIMIDQEEIRHKVNAELCPGIQATPKRFVVCNSYYKGKLAKAQLEYRSYINGVINHNLKEKKKGQVLEPILAWKHWLVQNYKESAKVTS